MYLNKLFLMLFTTGYILFPRLALAQIIPDSTIANPTRVDVDQSLDTVTLINGGTEKGTNLFHSFSQFDVAVTGSGGLPQSPRQLLGSTIWLDFNLRSTAPNLQSPNVKYQASNSTTVIEANQIIVEDGEVRLVNQVSYPIKDNTRTCLL